MALEQLLDIRPGVTAVIGGGGKTTLLRTLGGELSARHTVLLCTTTHLLPFPDLPCARTPEELEALRRQYILLCAGTEDPATGKLTAPALPMSDLANRFDYVLVEADGSARRPMKAHASHEPVIPPEANQTICVVGASGFGQPIRDAAHRPELYARLAGAGEADPITPETEAAVLKTERLHHRLFVNQVDTPENMKTVKQLATLMDGPILAGSLQKGAYFKC